MIHLNPGQKVKQWVILKKLGQGGFGAVYKCCNKKGQYALKLEGINMSIQLLKMDVVVLTEIAKHGGRHFCKIYDKGRYATFNYVVMTLVGKSLQILKKESPKHHLSMGTAISISIQTLEAIEDLHGIGYLHRDIKPGNFTIGRAELGQLRTVYILDFGMCRKFTSNKGVIRRPREVVGFRGTLRYAPISCHLQQEFCRKDDCESWLYMSIELTNGYLPWKNLFDIDDIGEYKQNVRLKKHENELFFGCPKEYKTILKCIDKLQYYDKPDYDLYYKLLRKALKSKNVQEFPYDWEKTK